MSPRSSIYDLPPELIEELNGELVSRNFSDYVELAEWLQSKGHRISKSALHRYGQGFQAEFESAMGEARELHAMVRASREAGGDDLGGELLGGIADTLQAQLMRLSIRLRNVDQEPEEAAKLLSLVSRAAADVGRMGLAQKKHEQGVRREEREKAAKAAEATARKAGVSPETVAAIRRDVLGMAE